MKKEQDYDSLSDISIEEYITLSQNHSLSLSHQQINPTVYTYTQNKNKLDDFHDHE
jgi:hypothetical protein